ncbi:MAG: tetratricopeptide repeat protein [Thermodesulfovibrionales bacterium]|nr:tetratricopeptide repeat protein [Thermodesulfovibrionales bacterium]
MDNIEKLKEKVEKDPASKLFVPLADEYRKAGRLDEAIKVLNTGIQRQPNYMSARVSLGKIYLEKGMKAEAKGEFEKVIQAIPDNLFAQRKLADIYRELGDIQNAISRYKAVLKLNPLDEDALSIVRDLEGGGAAAAGITEEALEPTMHEETPAPETTTILEEQIPTLEAEAEDVAEWGLQETAEEAPAFTIDIEKDASLEEAEVSLAGIPEEEEAAYTINEEEVPDFEFKKENIPLLEPVETEEIEMPAEEGEAFLEAIEEVEAEAPPIEEMFAADTEAATETFKEEPSPKMPDMAAADAYVAGDDYSGALKAYAAILKQNPNNAHVTQRIHELKGLLKFLGRDKDILVSRLETFLEGIKKRKNEFFGSP